MKAAISVEGLKKSYGAFEAVKGIDFEVTEGEVFGLLGPNGAGKTSTVEILEGLRDRTSGKVTVLGFDPAIDNRRLKDRIGVCLQSTNLPEKLRVLEAVRLFADFYSQTTHPEAILKRLQLWEKRNAGYATLSGGQKQRLALALALINNPSLLFLDEPSTGLDPQARLEIHSLVESLRAERRTILLTTHYIEEAEKLCDRVAIIDEGRIIAIGTPREIQARTVGRSMIEIRCEQPVQGGAPSMGAEVERSSVDDSGLVLRFWSARPARTVIDIVKWVEESGVGLEDLHVKRPSLEDVFIELTGKSLRE